MKHGHRGQLHPSMHVAPNETVHETRVIWLEGDGFAVFLELPLSLVERWVRGGEWHDASLQERMFARG